MGGDDLVAVDQNELTVISRNRDLSGSGTDRQRQRHKRGRSGPQIKPASGLDGSAYRRFAMRPAR